METQEVEGNNIFIQYLAIKTQVNQFKNINFLLQGNESVTFYFIELSI